VTCQLCGGRPIPFWTVHAVPTSSCVVFDDPDDARKQPVGDLALEVCPTCGFIQNGAFDPGAVDYLAPYEESQAASPTFRRFAQDTIERLIARYELGGGTALEVGCGKGEWLAMLCRAGDMHGIGIDPAFVPGRVPEEDAARFEVIVEFFGPESGLTGDLVACRHTLEHVPNVAEFTGWLSEAARRTDDATVFIEVPDAARILDEGAFWDVYYEHCGYFTTTSLGNLAAVSQLGIQSLDRGFGDQYLLLEAADTPTTPARLDAAATVDEALAFGDRARRSIEAWSRRIGDADRFVLWAATSKTVAFIAATGAEPVAVVDINPAKQGTYLPGSGAPVVSPEALGGIDPDLVLAMNPIYLDEIGEDLRRIGSGAELVALGHSTRAGRSSRVRSE
jgi:Methyltransferase domain/C-methyltransferase C-terminal domain